LNDGGSSYLDEIDEEQNIQKSQKPSDNEQYSNNENLLDEMRR